MAIRMRENQYVGVNAHLMSILQTPGTQEQPSSWPGFHAHYISHIMESLNTHLPSGYVAVNEQSLQILGEYLEGQALRRQPAPDVTIFQSHPVRTATGTAQVSAPTWQAAYDETPLEEDYTSGVVIYQQTGQGLWGTPIVRIELLSRSNKRGGTNYPDYRKKRQETFLSGIPLIEIDLLHETQSPISDLPIYPDEPDSHPYTVSVSDPRAGANRVQVNGYGFDLDSPFLIVPIPLRGDDFIGFDFGEAFQQAYEAGPWHVIVDYEQLPPRFETYSEADQERIQALMGKVKTTHDGE